MLRPQLFIAIIVLGIVGVWGLRVDSVEITSMTVGGIIALGMKLLDINNNPK